MPDSLLGYFSDFDLFPHLLSRSLFLGFLLEVVQSGLASECKTGETHDSSDSREVKSATRALPVMLLHLLQHRLSSLAWSPSTQPRRVAFCFAGLDVLEITMAVPTHLRSVIQELPNHFSALVVDV